MRNLKKELKNLIAEGRLEDAIHELKSLSHQQDDKTFENLVYNLSDQYRQYKRDTLAGTQEHDALNRTRNRLNKVALDLIDDLAPIYKRRRYLSPKPNQVCCLVDLETNLSRNFSTVYFQTNERERLFGW